MKRYSAAKRKERKMIGRELVRAGLLTPQELRFVLKEQKRLAKEENKKELLGEVILRVGFVDEKKLVKFLEEHLNIPHISLHNKADIDYNAVKLIPEKMARNFKLIAIKLNENTHKLVVAMNNPFDIIALDTIKAKTDYEIERCFSRAKDIEEAIDRFYAEGAMQKSVSDFIILKTEERKEEELYRQRKSGAALESEAVKTPVIEFVENMLKDAVQKRASDIHIEPSENKLIIRYRIDGMLYEMAPPPKEMESAITTRLKLLGAMDIAEQRLPQDGRFKFELKDRSVDVRMASSPTMHGEKMVLRILDGAGLLLHMEDLGMPQAGLEEFKRTLKQSYGMVLVSGPTGSGKTTTLYSALNYINTPEKNIVTIEDPVEYNLKGISQIQTKHHIGLTFASGLRSVLRQDPDVIMIGEIRDLETLENAVKASLTGHLVLSTIHTNNAPNVVLRLMHMGLEPYLIASCLTLVIAQRLVRKICENCKEKTVLAPAILREFEERARMDLKRVSFSRGKGCDRCGNTGYIGRIGLFELMVVSKKIREMILAEANEEAIKKVAEEEGMKSIFQNGIDSVKEGITTIEEVLRVTVLEKDS